MEPYSKFRYRIYKRRNQRRLQRVWTQGKDFFKKYVFRRTEHLKQVQRFVAGWLAIMLVGLVGLGLQLDALAAHYLIPGPRGGGSLSEGVVGKISALNPLFPESNATAVANKLIFNGLVRYNGHGKIEGDLAESWRVDASGRRYVFKLRSNAYWHDGQPLRAQDVVFTFQVVQDPATTSPLTAGWRGVKVSQRDNLTVVFDLPSPSAVFLDALTTGILPAHLLANVEPTQLRKVAFNQQPVGTGPFEFKDFSLARDELRLGANPRYFRGRPRLSEFAIHLYQDQESLVQAYSGGQVRLAGGLRSLEVQELDQTVNSRVLELPIADQSMVFFNTRQALLRSRAVRRGLVQAINITAITAKLNNGFEPSEGPLLPGQIGFRSSLHQLPYSSKKAKATLQKAGWKAGKQPVRFRHGRKLSLQLVTQNNDIYPTVATALQQQWAKVGVGLRVKLVSLDELQKKYVPSRRYDMILTGIAQGADPDVYAYWHSSQLKPPGLNLAQYRSATADQLLELGRSSCDQSSRAVKYQIFTRIWARDAPALAIFQPNYLYGVRQSLLGVHANFLSTAIDRFHNVEDWTINTQPIIKRLHK